MITATLLASALIGFALGVLFTRVNDPDVKSPPLVPFEAPRPIDPLHGVQLTHYQLLAALCVMDPYEWFERCVLLVDAQGAVWLHMPAANADDVSTFTRLYESEAEEESARRDEDNADFFKRMGVVHVQP